MKRAYFGALTLAGVVHSGCTFYTACPTPAPPAAAGSSVNGNGGNGTGTGGTSGNGNGNGNGGTSITTGGNEPTGEWVNETFNLGSASKRDARTSGVSSRADDMDTVVSCAEVPPATSPGFSCATRGLATACRTGGFSTCGVGAQGGG